MLTPAVVYHGRGAQILKTREEIKKQTIRQRRLQHQSAAAYAEPETEPEPRLQKRPLSPKNPDDGHAASVAGLLITTEAMIADRPSKESAGGGMGGMGGMV